MSIKKYELIGQRLVDKHVLEKILIFLCDFCDNLYENNYRNLKY